MSSKDPRVDDETARVFDDFWRDSVWDGAPGHSPEEKEENLAWKLEFLLDLLADRHYERALEVGCGTGWLTRAVSPLVDGGTAVDASPLAIERARQLGSSRFTYEVGDIMRFDVRAAGPWDLVLVNETMPYVGWRRSFFDVGYLARELYEATRPNGRLLLSNTVAGVQDWLYRPWLIHTYRDLFRNVGYELTDERRLDLREGEVELSLLVSLFTR